LDELDKRVASLENVVALSEPQPKKAKLTATPLAAELRDRGFSADDDGFVMVYTDGACTNNGRKGAGEKRNQV